MEPENLLENGTSFSSSSDGVNEKDVDNVALKTLNDLIVVLDINHPRASSIMHISSSIYPAIFEKIFGYQPQDLIVPPKTIEDEVHNIQCVIDTLSLDILGVSLSHITGEDILARKSLPIYHLLDLISEFVKVRDLQSSRSTESVSVPVSTCSSVRSSNASHREHFCPACESGSSETHPGPEGTISASSIRSITSTLPSTAKSQLQSSASSTLSSIESCSLRDSIIAASSSRTTGTLSSTSGPCSSKSEMATSRSASSGVIPTRKRMKNKSSINEKLTEKLVHNLGELKKTLATTHPTIDTVSLPIKSASPLDDLYKAVFQRSMRKKVPTPSKETSVLLPRYLKRRRSIVRTKVTPSKRQKCQASEQDRGILEEIKSNVPGVLFTQDGLHNLRLDHKRQVQFLSSQLTSLKNKVSASDKMLHRNILKQVQLADIDLKDKEDAERLRDVNSLRNERLKASGAIKNKSIQRARMKRYYDQYHLKHHQKLSSHKAREESLLQDLYKHRLTIQKQQAIDLSKDLREQEKEEARQLENRLASVQNFYIGKSEIQKERAMEQHSQKEVQIRAQHQVLEETRKAILKQIEKEVKQIQENLERQDDFHFVQADAERLKERWAKPR